MHDAICRHLLAALNMLLCFIPACNVLKMWDAVTVQLNFIHVFHILHSIAMSILLVLCSPERHAAAQQLEFAMFSPQLEFAMFMLLSWYNTGRQYA